MGSSTTARWIERGVLRTGGLDDVPPGFAGPLWVDLTDPDEAAFATVSARYPLPPLAVEDCLHFPQRPKVDVYADVTFAIWLAPYLVHGEGLMTHELDIFLGPEHLVTAHHDGFDALDEVAAQAGEYLGRGVEWTLHAILDRTVDGVFPLVEGIADELEELEDRMLESARPELLERLFAAKRALVKLHKVIGPERDVVRALARLEAFVEPEAYMYFQDVGDHLSRAADSIETYREVANGTMDIFLSSQSNRMNQIMKTLTVVATIFMPLTLISGIYGMNFRFMPELDWRFGYFGALALMGAVALGMTLYFRRRDWW